MHSTTTTTAFDRSLASPVRALIALDGGAIPTTEPIPVARPERCAVGDARRRRGRGLGVELDTLKVLVLSVVLLGVVSGLV